MSAKFAAWIRVTPPATTLAESSAVYQALSKQGRVNVFTRSKDLAHEQANQNDGSSSTFYAVFPHEPPSLRMTFDAPLYHNVPNAHDEDPFNIRGLQNRKPMPAPKTFSCVIERADRNDVRSQEEAIVKGSPYHGHFEVERNGWLQDVLVETNAPPGVAKGCGIRTRGDIGAASSLDSDELAEQEEQGKTRKIDMGSLMKMWHKANASKEHRRVHKGTLGD